MADQEEQKTTVIFHPVSRNKLSQIHETIKVVAQVLDITEKLTIAPHYEVISTTSLLEKLKDEFTRPRDVAVSSRHPIVIKALRAMADGSLLERAKEKALETKGTSSSIKDSKNIKRKRESGPTMTLDSYLLNNHDESETQTTSLNANDSFKERLNAWRFVSGNKPTVKQEDDKDETRTITPKKAKFIDLTEDSPKSTSQIPIKRELNPAIDIDEDVLAVKSVKGKRKAIKPEADDEPASTKIPHLLTDPKRLAYVTHRNASLAIMHTHVPIYQQAVRMSLQPHVCGQIDLIGTFGPVVKDELTKIALPSIQRELKCSWGQAMPAMTADEKEEDAAEVFRQLKAVHDGSCQWYPPSGELLLTGPTIQVIRRLASTIDWTYPVAFQAAEELSLKVALALQTSRMRSTHLLDIMLPYFLTTDADERRKDREGIEITAIAQAYTAEAKKNGKGRISVRTWAKEIMPLVWQKIQSSWDTKQTEEAVRNFRWTDLSEVAAQVISRRFGYVILSSSWQGSFGRSDMNMPYRADEKKAWGELRAHKPAIKKMKYLSHINNMLKEEKGAVMVEPMSTLAKSTLIRMARATETDYVHALSNPMFGSIAGSADHDDDVERRTVNSTQKAAIEVQMDLIGKLYVIQKGSRDKRSLVLNVIKSTKWNLQSEKINKMLVFRHLQEANGQVIIPIKEVMHTGSTLWIEFFDPIHCCAAITCLPTWRASLSEASKHDILVPNDFSMPIQLRTFTIKLINSETQLDATQTSKVLSSSGVTVLECDYYTRPTVKQDQQELRIVVKSWVDAVKIQQILVINDEECRITICDDIGSIAWCINCAMPGHDKCEAEQEAQVCQCCEKLDEKLPKHRIYRNLDEALRDPEAKACPAKRLMHITNMRIWAHAIRINWRNDGILSMTENAVQFRMNYLNGSFSAAIGADENV